MESLEAIVAVLDHALETLAGPFDHGRPGREPAAEAVRDRVPEPSPTSRPIRSSSSCSGAPPRSSPSSWRAICGSSRPPARRPPSRAVRRHPASVRRPDPVRVRPDQDVQGPARRADARRDLLGLRPADDRHGQHRHRRAHPGGHLDARSTAPCGPRLGDAERRRGRSSWSRSLLGVRAAADLAAAPPDVQPRRADHPGDDRRGRRRPSSSPRSSRSPATATIPGAFVAERARRRRSRGLGRRRRSRPRSSSCGGRTSRSSRRSCVYLPVQQAPPHRDRASRTSGSASSRRAASCRRWTSRREDATFGLKTLQDLGWKDLLDGFTCTECGRCQAACPAECHRASRSTPRPSSWASGTCRSRPSTAST